MRAPCKDCPNRAAECRTSCEKWRKYEGDYFEHYAQRTKEKEHELDYYSFHIGQMAKGTIFKRRQK